MNAVKWIIARWRLVFVPLFLLVLLGINSLLTIPRSVDPHFPIPIITVVASLPGADSMDVEQSVLQPIERAVRAIDKVDEIRALASNGSAIIAIEFDWDGDPDQYYADVVREVASIRSKLPTNLELEFRKARTTEAAVMQLALTSDDASWRRLSKYAEDLQVAMTRVDGVREVRVVGLPTQQVEVAFEPGRLAELGLSQQSVVDALASEGVERPPGAIENGNRRFNIDSGGVFRDLDAIRSVALRSSNGSLLTVGDVAEVRWGIAEHVVQSRLNERRAVWLAITQKDGIDAIRLKAKLDEAVTRQRALMPADIAIEPVFDQTRDIVWRLNELARDFAIALSLVFITLLPIGWRAALAAMTAVPLSLASGLLAVDLAGYNLSQLTIAGFIVALGLLIDDAIVVAENISRHLRQTPDRIAASIAATREIAMPVIGSTGVLVFAFMPLLFLPDGAGEFTRPFILAIVVTVAASLVVSLVVVPFLASRILSRDNASDSTVMLRWMMRVIEASYRPALRIALERPKLVVWSALSITASALLLVPAIGFSLFPYADTSFFRVTIEVEQGSSVANTSTISTQVVQLMKKEESIKVRAETVGASHPQVFYNVTGFVQRADYAEVLAVLDHWDGSESYAMLERLQKKFDGIPGAKIQIQLFQNGASSSPPIIYRIVGEDLGTLSILASKVESVLKDTTGTRGVINPLANPQIEIAVETDNAKAALLRIGASDVREALRRALTGQRASTFRDNEGDSYPVMVELHRDRPQDYSILERVYVATPDGTQVPLSQVASLKFESVPRQIQHFQLQRTVGVTSQIERGYLASEVNQSAASRVAALALPKGYSIEVGGEAEAISKTFVGFVPAVLVALFGIVFILLAEFCRLRETIVALGVIPLGIFGGIIALLITGNSLSYMTIIGFVALIGIEIKNSILLVDFTSRLRERGVRLRDAVEEAGKIRFLPVLLTSVTAVGGLLPLALFGGSLYSSLAWVIIGGLVSSTLLSRIVTPAMYFMLADKSEMDSELSVD